MCTRVITAFLGPCLGAGLSGCVVSSPPAHYTIDIRNTSEQAITMDLIRVERGQVGHTRADLMPGGVYLNEFSVDSRFDFVEARFRLAGRSPDDPFYPFELPRYGSAKRDVGVREERIVMLERKVEQAK